MFHGKTMFICNSHEKSSYLSSSVYRGRLLWIENIVRIKFVLILKNKAFNECRFVHKLILISFRWQKKRRCQGVYVWPNSNRKHYLRIYRPLLIYAYFFRLVTHSSPCVMRCNLGGYNFVPTILSRKYYCLSSTQTFLGLSRISPHV